MTSISSRSLNAKGASRPLLSIVSATSALLRAGLAIVPAKMTSSISPPRIRLAELSPITQRSASTRLDLPQPLGPTIPVRPGSIASSVASTNDLNPTRRSRQTRITQPRPVVGSRFRGEPRQHLVELFDCRCAGEFGAVNEEGRGRIYIQFFRRDQAFFDDFVFERSVFQAFVELVLAHAAEPDQPGEGLAVIAGRHPFLLLRKKRIDIGIEAVARRAARNHRGPQGWLVERVIAKHQFHFPGVDPLLLQFGKNIIGEMSAVGASQRGVFDDRN